MVNNLWISSFKVGYQQNNVLFDSVIFITILVYHTSWEIDYICTCLFERIFRLQSHAGEGYTGLTIAA